MLRTLRALLRDVNEPPMLSDVLKASRETLREGITPAKQLWAEADPRGVPTREEAKERLAMAELMAEIAWREREREQERQDAPGNKVIYIRRVNS